MATATVVVVVAEKFWLLLIAHKKHVIKNHNVRFDGFALALPFSSNSSTSFWKLLMPMGNILMAGYARGLQEHLPRGWQHGQWVPALDNFRISLAHNWQGSLSPKNKFWSTSLAVSFLLCTWLRFSLNRCRMETMLVDGRTVAAVKKHYDQNRKLIEARVSWVSWYFHLHLYVYVYIYIKHCGYEKHIYM